MLREITLAGAFVSLFSAPSIAHHSFAMFDVDTTFERQARVVEFQWTNPHAWLEVMIEDSEGQSTQWSLEMSSPGSLANDGWRPRTVVAGDEVTVRFHPKKDGTPTGQFQSMVAPNGETLGE